MIELHDVTVSYPGVGKRSNLALAPFTERVESGEWVGVIGPNGAGKSSLLRAIAGLVDHNGTIDVDGQPQVTFQFERGNPAGQGRLDGHAFGGFYQQAHAVPSSHAGNGRGGGAQHLGPGLAQGHVVLG